MSEMNEIGKIYDNQSFSVDDIRRLRTELDEKYSKMTREEIWADIAEKSENVRRIKAEIKAKKERSEAFPQ